MIIKNENGSFIVGTPHNQHELEKERPDLYALLEGYMKLAFTYSVDEGTLDAFYGTTTTPAWEWASCASKYIQSEHDVEGYNHSEWYELYQDILEWAYDRQ